MTESATPRPANPSRTTLAVVLLIVVVAAAVRIPGIFTDLWLDEIWSIDIARQATNPLQLLLADFARIDNNHPLNTWLLHVIGDVQRWWIYRVPALVSGVGCVIAAAHAMRRHGGAEMIAAATLVALGYPLVFYSSEARGYALATCFAIVAFDALHSFLRRPGVMPAVVFNLACVLGFLSHLTFVHFYLGAMLWSVFCSRRITRSVGGRLLAWLKLNALPVLLCAFLYFAFVRRIVIGGAWETDPLDVLIQSLSMSLGGPGGGPFALMLAIVTAALVVGSVVSLFRRRDDLWLFYVLAVIVAPMFLLVYDRILSEKPQPLMLRYFLVAITMMLLAIAHGTASMWRSGAAGRLVCIVLALGFLYGNTMHLRRFLKLGRGHYSDAVRTIFAESSSPTVTVASDSTWRTGVVIDFYAKRLAPPGRAIDFYGEQRREHPPEWIIEDGRRQPLPTKRLPDGATYQLAWIYRAGELSGFRWHLYRVQKTD